MSTVSKVPNDGSVTRVLSSSRGDVMGKAMAVMLAQYTSLQNDLDSQIAAIEERNATKKAWNDQLSKINKLLQSPEFMGKQTKDEVTLTIRAEDMPYKEYAVQKDAAGNVTLTPVPEDESNMVSNKNLQPIYGPLGTDPATAEQNLKAKTNELVALQLQTRPAVPLTPETPGKLARIEQLKAEIAAIKSGPVIGYKVTITAEQLNKQLDVVRTSIDDLNADGQIDTLRMSDLFSKSNAKIEQLSKILSSVNETSQKIISSMA